ncbi:MAG: aldo/keto reductase [Microbacteriaceae bacterium]
MNEIPRYELLDGHSIPPVGFGTYPLRGEDAATAVASALSLGYRLVDSAVNYKNEDAVGRGISQSGVPRNEIVVTTKLPGRHHGYDQTIESFQRSRSALNVETVDLYLIHWPNPSVGKFVESWRAMIQLQQDGLITSIGVSNFTEEFLIRLQDETAVLPSVNQIEMHPYFPQSQLRAVHDRLGIRTQSWSPLGRGRELLTEAAIVEAAAFHRVSAAQVVLRWQLQLGAVPIPKSQDPVRQRENLEVFGFDLDDGEMQAISALGRPDGRITGADPNTHEEM